MSGHRNRTWALVVALGLTVFNTLQPVDARAACSGCGGGGSQQAPCFTQTGQLVYQYTGPVFGGGIIYHETITRLGPCQFRDVLTRISAPSGPFWDVTYAAGCPCGGPDAPYSATGYPSFALNLVSLTDTQVILQSPQGLVLVKVIDIFTGAPIYTQGPVTPTGSIVVPRTALPNGVYLVEGFVASGRLDGATVLRVTSAGITTGLRQVVWADPDPSNYPVRQIAVYTSSGEAKIVLQRQDNSLELVSGTTSVNVPGLSPAALPIVGAGLLLCAGLVIWRRREHGGIA